MITIKETFCSSVLAQINKETKHCALFNDRNVLSLSLSLSISFVCIRSSLEVVLFIEILFRTMET